MAIAAAPVGTIFDSRWPIKDEIPVTTKLLTARQNTRDGWLNAHFDLLDSSVLQLRAVMMDPAAQLEGGSSLSDPEMRSEDPRMVAK
jgi:hypothetical protein